MYKIKKIFKAIERFLVRAGKLIDSNSKTISLFLSIVAIAVTLFNVQQIKKQANLISGLTTPEGKVVADSESIKDKIPSNTPFLGNPKAKLIIVEFGDYQCPYCGKFHSEYLPKLKRDYLDNNKAKFVFLNVAFLGQESKDAAEASYCARDQGKFWEYHDVLFSNQKAENSGAFSGANLKKFATSIGLDINAFQTCTASGKYTKLIADNLALASKYGINATPGFIIGNQSIKGALPFANFKQAIDSQFK
ncbi:DsbA family protein [Patescibacteria group bacterium]|nr:DsbA family protein [Patescibacteria group bacterium]